ncbi:Amino acid transporter domain-containing protein [Rozella allomycis CSF55]|uniref:Amino acid transporter domain-containing protein n=1 Tax=Rozella allomycis (strain CSF55) TaxID=988480 RepID=A0A075AX56_ROZAC|nr:Amino acid transporter domain-containing protein [Rozella allomycis CSF55]|eukprot:EPZ33307.1 Amino acid transporter domain-containing protein [Rozella allomycis CSF55]
MLGVGILSIPYILKTNGWVLGTSLMMIVMLIALTTNKMIARCMKEYPQILSFPSIAEVSFGKQAGQFVYTVFILECFASACAYIILAGNTLNAIFPAISSDIFKIIAWIVIIPTVWPTDYSYLAYASILGLTGTSFMFIVIFMCGFLATSSPGSLLKPAETKLFPESLADIPLTFGPIMFCFAGHTVTPTIILDMKQPKLFNRMITSTYAVVTTVFLSMGIAGHFMFGQDTESEFTLNLAFQNEYPRLLIKVCLGLIVINPLTKFALRLKPVFQEIETLLIGDPLKPKRGIRPESLSYYTMRTILRTCISLGTLVVGINFKRFMDLQAIIGALFSFLVCAIVPSVCYLKLFAKTMTKVEKMLTITLILISTAMSSFGTFCVIKDMANA